ASISCDYIPGCSLFFPTTAILELGYLKEDYFMYFEETDWCLHAQTKSYSLMTVPSSVVFHHFNDAKMQAPFTVYYYNRNTLMFWYNFSDSTYKLFSWLKSLFIKIPQCLIAYVQAGDSVEKATFKSHILAHIHYVCFKKGKQL
ncbi:MAG: hypothetical protein KBD63_08075, partial [Bacteriovoracaceae bacterium]|nr:hypothetical protein [Bacteriovoracaceae bacterium]